jgi:hypothetical protein
MQLSTEFKFIEWLLDAHVFTKEDKGATYLELPLVKAGLANDTHPSPVYLTSPPRLSSSKFPTPTSRDLRVKPTTAPVKLDDIS